MDANHEIERMTAKKNRSHLMIFLSLAMLVVAIIVSLCIGRYHISVLSVIESLFNGIKCYFSKVFNVTNGFTNGENNFLSTEDNIIWLVRIPRVIAAVLVGGSLSFSGATYQSLFRNPMVSPDILGASAGASVGACLMMLFEQNTVMVQIGAFAFGILAVLISYLSSKIVNSGKTSTLNLILCGMAVGALFQSIVSVIKYMADPDSQLPEMTYWLMGSIAKVNYDDLLFFVVSTIVGVVPIIIIGWKLNVISMGEEEAKAMGVNVSAVRLICIVCATMLTATVISFAGTVGWIGLMIPHLCRFLVGSNNKYLLPMSFVSGGLFLLIIDGFCRTLFAYEIPLGVLTSILGTPFFIFVLCRKRENL